VAKRKTRQIILPALIIKNPFPIGPQLPEKIRWSVSKAKLFNKCKRKFFWKYLLHLRHRAKAAPLLFGGYFHEALAEWYRAKRSSMKKIAARYALAAEKEIREMGDYYDQYEYDKLMTLIETFQGMLVGYAAIYNHERKTWIIDREGIEAEKTIDLGEFNFIFKTDLITRVQLRIRIKNLLVEHKTASRIPESYMDKLPLDFQVRGYIFGANHSKGLNKSVSEVIYDVVKKCKLKRKSNESPEDFNQRIAQDYIDRPEFYFFRETLKFNKADIAAFEFELRQTHAEYQWLISTLKDPLDPRYWAPADNICGEFFKTCPYQLLCLSGLDRGTGSVYEQYIKEEKNAEEN